ncbi:MAG: serine/threonine protein kinase [Cyanobacteria bacterium SZAS TMP-1]|nr:serine/threonine protein kinase [Cyanobacteria bacterium SZAS TMP-1]
MKTTESFDDSHNITLSGAASGAPSRELRPGDVIGGSYKLKSLLGRGGMGYVFCAEHTVLGIDYALKMLAPERLNDVSRRRFEVEGRAIAKLDHPNIVKVHNMGLDRGDCPFYVMDLLPGKSLADYISEGRKFALDELLDIFIQIAAGLAYAHSKGIVHRDVKPSNICLLEERGRLKVKIVDFGIAKLLPSASLHVQSQTNAGEVFGSPLYMSPEQGLGGQIDHRSDMYSLGCTFFEAITGRPPFRGENPLQTIMMHQDAEQPSVAEVTAGAYPGSVDQLLSKMMAKRPAQRYQSMQQLIHDLERLAAGKGIGSGVVYAVHEADEGETENPASFNPTKIFALAAVLLLVVASAGLMYLLRPSAGTEPVSGKGSEGKGGKMEKKGDIASLTSAVPGIGGGEDMSDPDPDVQAILIAKTANSALGDVLIKEKAEIPATKRSFDSAPLIVSRPVILPNGQKGRRFVFPSRSMGLISAAGPPPYNSVDAVGVKDVVDAPLTLSVGPDARHIVFYVPSIFDKIGNNEFTGLILGGLHITDKSNKDLGLPSESAAAEHMLKAASHWKKLESIHLSKLNLTEGMLKILNGFSRFNVLGLNKDTVSSKALAQQPFLLNVTILILDGIKDTRPVLEKLAQSRAIKGLRLFDCGLKPDDFRIIERFTGLQNFQIQEDDLGPLLPELAKLAPDLAIGGPKLSAAEIHLLCQNRNRQRVILRPELYSETEQKQLQALEPKVSFLPF